MLIESGENNWPRRLLFEWGRKDLFIFYFVNTRPVTNILDRVEDPSNQGVKARVIPNSFLIPRSFESNADFTVEAPCRLRSLTLKKKRDGQKN